MANKRMEFLIGIMVVTVFVTIVIMTVLFGAPKKLLPTGGAQKMTIVFDKAPGIGNNSRVMKSGVEIGRVYKSELIDETDKAEVRVYFNLNPGIKIYSNEYARINRTILGDAAIEFIKNPNYTGEIFERKRTDTITGVPGGDLMGTVSNIEGDLAKAIQSINGAAKELTIFMGNLNTFLGSPEELDRKKNRVEAIFKELGDTLITTRNLATNMNSIIGDKNVQNNIKSAAANVPEILAKVDALLGNANILADDFRETIAKTQQTFDKVGNNLDNMQNFTDALAEEGPEFISSLNESGARMREMVGNINTLTADLSRNINDTSTPLGMLGDPEVGSSLRGTIKNAETVSEKVQPILDDARVFSNKIAHKPSSLIWGGRNYKGTPALASADYNFQPFTPENGALSPLYTPTKRNIMQCPFSPAEEGETSVPITDPDSYTAYYAESPEVAGKSFLPCLAGNPLSFSLKNLFCRNKEVVLSEDALAYGENVYFGEWDGTVVDPGNMPGNLPVDMPMNGPNGAPNELRRSAPQGGVVRPNEQNYLEEGFAQGTAPAYGMENVPAQLPYDAVAKEEPLPGPAISKQTNADFQPVSSGTSAEPSAMPNRGTGPATPYTSGREESFVDDGLPLLYVPATEQ